MILFIKKHTKIFNLILIIIAFITSWAHPTDADLGWHLRFSEDVLTYRTIFFKNTYTSLMEGYDWVSSSWGADMIRFAFYQIGGFYGVAILGSLAVVAVLWTILKTKPLSTWTATLITITFLACENALLQDSFRGQIISIWGVALVIFLLYKHSKPPTKVRWEIPALFIIWTNLHGGSPVGIGIYFLWIVGEIIHTTLQTKNIISSVIVYKYAAITLLLSFIATNITPYGFTLYTDNLSVVGNAYAKSIEEFTPAPALSPIWVFLTVWCMLCGVSILILIKKKQLGSHLNIILPSLMLMGQSYGARRFCFILYALSPMLLVPVFDQLRPTNVIIRRLLLLTFTTIFLVCIEIYRFDINGPLWHMSWDSYCTHIRCSNQAAAIIEREYPNGKVYTNYGYGGWLIWQHRGFKPALDGRMSTWRDKSGFSGFGLYAAITSGVINIDDTNFDVIFVPVNDLSIVRFFDLVKEKKWSIRHRDDHAYVLVRNTNKTP